MAPLVSYDIYDNDIQEFERLVASSYRQGSRGALSDSTRDAGCRYLPEATLVEFFKDEERLKRILRRLFPNPDNPRLSSAILDRIREGEYRKVFAILLLIRRGPAIKYFTEDPELRDAKLPFDNPQRFPDQAYDPEFFDEFRKHQWMFCVEALRYRDFVKLSADQILPYKIEKTLPPGVSSKAFVIKVDSEYNELYSSSKREPPDIDRHTFVLKSFENEIPDGKEQYDQELNSFASILHAGNDPNIVSFFGSFKHGDTFNTILEYANGGTLEDLMQRKDPPKTPEDLYELWGALSRLLQGLVTLHNLKFPSEDGEGFICHYDLKPRNILVFVRGDDTHPLYEFKLADLGLSSFRVKVRANKQSLAAAGTLTYGAPELYRTHDGMNFPLLQAGPEVDIWSCGCVFSEVATWILGGRSGLENFREMRSQAHQNMAPQGSDCFHDGFRLLECIAEHHASLREQTPSDDPLTKGILRIIGDHMLVDKLQRYDASKLFRKANQIHHKYRTMRSSTSTVSSSGSSANIPPLNLSTSTGGTEITPPWHTSLPTIMHDGWGYNAQGQAVAAYIRPHDEGDPHLPAMQLSPPLRPFPTDHHYSPYPHLAVQEPIPRVQHTSSRGQDLRAPPPPIHPFDQTNPVQHPAAFQQHILHDNSPHSVLQGNSAATERHLVQSGLSSPVIGSPARGDNARANYIRPESSEDWSQESPSRPSARESLQPNSNPNAIQPRIPSSPTTRSELPHFSVEDVHQRRNNRKPLPPYYTRDLVDRDFVFLIDNSSSMRHHWPHVQTCVNILGYEVKRFDKDGIEICFTLSSATKKHKNTTPLVDEVKKLLPADLQTNLRTKTNIYTSLGSMLDEYRGLIEQRRNVKKKIIFVLTDGLWQPHCAESLVQSLRNLVSSLSQHQSPMDQIGIQFIQFGDYAEATEVLQYLDKLCSLENLERDIVDCERYHAKANVWKMLVGSINRWADDDGDVNNHDELALNSNTISASASHPTPHPP